MPLMFALFVPRILTALVGHDVRLASTLPAAAHPS